MIGFWRVAEERPDDLGVVDAYRSSTWSELAARANRLSNALTSLGVGVGGHIAVLMGNRAEYLEAYAAIFTSGRYLTGINWHFTAAEAAYVLADCDAQVLVVDEANRDRGLEAAESAGVRNVFTTGPEYEHLLAAHAPEPRAPTHAGVWMPYTGGTTGRPKGVYRPLPGLSPGEALAARAAMADRFGLGEGGVHLVTGPLYHNAPMGFASSTLHLGQTQVVPPRFDARDVLGRIEAHGVTTTHMVPTMFRRLLDLPDETRRAAGTSSLRSVVHGAAPCPKWVKHAMIEWLGPVLVEYYGATEGGLTVVTSEEWLERPGTVGRPTELWDVEVRDDDGEPLAAREPGLIWFKPTTPAPGFSYYKDDRQTREAYAADGSFSAGDVGFLDEDGYLYLVDRRKELIISGGVNIYPVEVEEVLSEHPDVADVCVFGIPNEEWGEEVKAAVVLRDGATTTGRDLIAWGRERMAHYKVPRSVDVLDALPRDETGKLFRRQLRAPYWEGRASAISVDPRTMDERR